MFIYILHIAVGVEPEVVVRDIQTAIYLCTTDNMDGRKVFHYEGIAVHFHAMLRERLRRYVAKGIKTGERRIVGAHPHVLSRVVVLICPRVHAGPLIKFVGTGGSAAAVNLLDKAAVIVIVILLHPFSAGVINVTDFRKVSGFVVLVYPGAGRKGPTFDGAPETGPFPV